MEPWSCLKANASPSLLELSSMATMHYCTSHFDPIVYSFCSTHTILSCLPKFIQTILFPFTDNILACYKDGTNGTRNCYYSGVVYHVAVIVLVSNIMWAQGTFFMGVIAFVCMVLGMLVAVIRPYKSTEWIPS